MRKQARDTRVLFYAGRFSHPFFREQFRHPPEGVTYVPSTAELLGDGFKSDLRNAHRLRYRVTRRLSREAVRALGLAGVPRVAYVRPRGSELVHSSRHLLLNPQPWVVEVEIASAFAWYSRRNLDRALMKRRMEGRLASPWCRKILPWTEAAKKSLLAALDCRRFAHKIEVVYPCIAAKPVDPAARRARREFTLLFVGPGFYGAGFYTKGGLETLLAFDRLARRYPGLRLEMVCLPPASVLERWGRRRDITFRSRVPNDELEALYRRADVFVLPTHIDTLGFVYLEAFSYGVPCVGTQQFAVPEIITDGVTGFTAGPASSNFGADGLPRHEPALYDGHPLVEEWKQPAEDYLSNLTEALARLVEDPALRGQMSAAAYDEVQCGRFSVTRRREALRRIYEESLEPARRESAAHKAVEERLHREDEVIMF